MNNLKFILIPSSLVAILFYIYSYFLFPEYLDEVPGEFDAINGYKKTLGQAKKVLLIITIIIIHISLKT